MAGGAQIAVFLCVTTQLKVVTVILTVIMFDRILIMIGRESICGGGEVVFNTSHPNYFNSLLVENLWMCSNVSYFLYSLL